MQETARKAAKGQSEQPRIESGSRKVSAFLALPVLTLPGRNLTGSRRPNAVDGKHDSARNGSDNGKRGVLLGTENQ